MGPGGDTSRQLFRHLGSLHHLAVPSPKVLESSAGSSAKREGERVENPECRKLKWPSLEGSPISCHFPLVSIWSRSPTSLQAEAGKCGWCGKLVREWMALLTGPHPKRKNVWLWQHWIFYDFRYSWFPFLPTPRKYLNIFVMMFIHIKGYGF